MNHQNDNQLYQCRTRYKLNRQKQNDIPNTPNQSINSNPIYQNNNNLNIENNIINDPNKITTKYSLRNSEANSTYSQNINNNNNNYLQNGDNLPENKSVHTHSVVSNNTNYTNKYLCQSCINEYLMNQKIQKDKEYNTSYKIPPFEDKMKDYDNNLINNRIKTREENSRKVYNTLQDINNKNNQKENFIYKTEHEKNSINDYPNNNYLYERTKRNNDEMQKMINNNLDKFKNRERPEITSYFNSYVNNEELYQKNYNQMQNELEQQAKKKENELKKYKEDLKNQIENNKKKKEEENLYDLKVQKEYEDIQKQIEDEANKRYKKVADLRDKVQRENLEIIKSKNIKKKEEDDENKEFENKVKNKILSENEEIENKAYRNKIKMANLLRDNYDYAINEKKKNNEDLLNGEDNNNNFNYFCKECVEDVDQCAKCHKTFPRKYLTINRNFYTNKRK